MKTSQNPNSRREVLEKVGEGVTGEKIIPEQ
jgi:hypothetical protein